MVTPNHLGQLRKSQVGFPPRAGPPWGALAESIGLPSPAAARAPSPGTQLRGRPLLVTRLGCVQTHRPSGEDSVLLAEVGRSSPEDSAGAREVVGFLCPGERLPGHTGHTDSTNQPGNAPPTALRETRRQSPGAPRPLLLRNPAAGVPNCHECVLWKFLGGPLRRNPAVPSIRPVPAS